MTDAFEETMATVLAEVTPDDEERERLRRVAREVVDRTRDAVTALDLDADVLLVGSTARDSWLAGERDVDVFVRFPPDIPREDLEDHGLAVGHRVLPEGRQEFAEHPYVTGEVDGVDVDLVPCYRVDSASEIRSAVDRTPFHSRYVERALDESLANEVRLLKGFCAGIDVYGSDLRTEGFSGYLTELLVIEFGSFRGVIEAAADWHPPVRIDPEGHGIGEFDDRLVVVDPTDPGRNVAAVLSTTNLARFQHHARALLAGPDPSRFFGREPGPLGPEELLEHLERRGTTAIAIRFDPPDLVDDQLYPQLRKSINGIASALDRRGFDVFRTATFADETAVFLLELAVTERPSVERHVGPPVHARQHAEGFYRKYVDSSAYGPFVDGDRYVVERPRDHTSATSFLESEAIFDVSLGANVVSALEDGFDVLVDDAVVELCGEFGVELARYYDPRP